MVTNKRNKDDFMSSDTTPIDGIVIYKTVTRDEWDKKHRDGKCYIDGQPYMMFLDNGATILAPVSIAGSAPDADNG